MTKKTKPGSLKHPLLPPSICQLSLSLSLSSSRSATHPRVSLFADRSLQGARPQDALQGRQQGEHHQPVCPPRRGRGRLKVRASGGGHGRTARAAAAGTAAGAAAGTAAWTAASARLRRGGWAAAAAHGAAGPLRRAAPWPSAAASGAVSPSPRSARPRPSRPSSRPSRPAAAQPGVRHEGAKQDVRNDCVGHRQVLPRHLPRHLHLLPADVLDHLPAPQRRRSRRPRLPPPGLRRRRRNKQRNYTKRSPEDRRTDGREAKRQSQTLPVSVFLRSEGAAEAIGRQWRYLLTSCSKNIPYPHPTPREKRMEGLFSSSFFSQETNLLQPQTAAPSYPSPPRSQQLTNN